MVDPIANNVNSQFTIWYLDDATIVGTEETVLSDLRTLKLRWVEIGLKTNDTKSIETLLQRTSEESAQTVRAFKDILTGIKIVPRESCTSKESG